jgi:hypothetical protein
MSVRLTCPMCHGTGLANNPPSFYDEGKTPEVSINCKSCKGEGYIEEHNPAGVRVSVLLARKIKSAYPQFRSWEEVYLFIVANTSNAVNVSTTSAMWAKQHTEDPTFEDDAVFSEDTLAIDPYLEKLIEKGSFLKAAKGILGIQDKE